MIQVALISEQTLKDTVPISANNSITSPLKQSIFDAQEFYIKPILCEALYTELQDQIRLQTVTPNNQALLDIISPCLAYWVYYRYLPVNWAKVREQGVVNQTGNTATNISLNDLTYLRGEAESSAQMYQIRLVCYLEANKTLYPLLQECLPVKKTKRFRYI